MRKVGWGGECQSLVSWGAAGDASAAHEKQLNSAVWSQGTGACRLPVPPGWLG